MDELDRFMTSLENIGILHGWSDFMKQGKGQSDGNDSEEGETK